MTAFAIVHRACLGLCGIVLSVWLPARAAEPTPCVASGAQDRAIASESYRIPSEMPGIELYMRNKRPNGVDLFPSERIVLYVHGATYPSETAFDLQLAGFSWMDFLACRGFDVYLVDLRGYGQSTRPPEMDRPAADSPPIVTTDVAVRDVGAAVAHIMNRRKVKRISLIGWSWGTTIMGADPKDSVVDTECRTHDHPNLFVAGSAVMPTAASWQPATSRRNASSRSASASPPTMSAARGRRGRRLPSGCRCCSPKPIRCRSSTCCGGKA